MGKLGGRLPMTLLIKPRSLVLRRQLSLAGEEVRVLIVGVLADSGLDAGDIFIYLILALVNITTTPPSTAGRFLLHVSVKQPLLLNSLSR